MAFAASHPYHSASSSPYAEQHREYHHQHPHHYQNNSESSLNLHETNNKSSYYSNTNLPASIPCDIKPRLTKEQHDILESHYQKQPKPNTNTKKGFAKNLQVSLDKVNNWFQNRRAKSKQDAKKQAGTYNLYAQPSSGAPSVTFSSDSDASPAFSSGEYFSMMQQCDTDEQMSSGGNMGTSSLSQYDDKTHGLPYSNVSIQFHNNGNDGNNASQHLQSQMFDSPQEMNRRTMTQEQFDAFAQTSMMQSTGQFDNLQNDFSVGDDVLQEVFPEIDHNDYKSSNNYSFPAPMAAPLSSCDSSIPSTISEQSMFPSSGMMQRHANMSTESLDWSDSRSSSVSMPSYHANVYQQMTPHAQQQPAPATSQWHPGQSIPVDPNALQQQFREAAQRQSRQQVPQEQSMAWPVDESFVRRDSQNGSMLAQQMSAFAIQTPQPQQTASFQSPPPPPMNAGGIAARRQKPRPANLGIAALRSQSYSGPAQPGSPVQQSANMAPSQPQLRRIRSSNVLGGIAQGRVMKSTPGSAQRSPMAFSFAEAMASPRIARHASTSDLLAPPTPHSPRESNWIENTHSRPQLSSWQSSSGQQFSRQASISETDIEHDVPIQAQTFTSPPRTPMYSQRQPHQQQSHQQLQQSQQQQSQQQQQQQIQQQHNVFVSRVGNNVITENTPPQSAPASQQSFPQHTFMAPPPIQSQPQPYTPPQAHQFMTAAPLESSYQMPAVSYAPPQQYVQPTVESQQQDLMQFANGVPMVDAHGHLTMTFPAPPTQQMQFVQHVPPQSQHQSSTHHITTPPNGGQYSFVTSESNTPSGLAITSGIPKSSSSQPAEFFVHEYSPPEEIKNASTTRRPMVDSGPKNYTFNNHGPGDFGKDKSKKLGGMSSPGTGTSSS
ncbi:unnamed protein product [Zymoseptoria tritici ST99CH_1A5]|uniref:Homeobox domain-containing protein n=3 Tax=Zymoseptoria tritici TaxID=1047171 RepID=A0A1X7RGL7_ZYMT9|nr:unnamed protein product [Zymoseptoria tritici ST99CH_3D7]SMR42896.1 unnamed protein product [Zymoseptoria tritici ST99CH_1E4]SMY20231.1 unnamed protein product [Zymoseptoria tritici ST99CH_1A5]